MRTTFPAIPVIALALIGMTAQSVSAHHGWSSYNVDKPLTIEGEVVKSDFGYPHATIAMQYEGKLWTIVLAPPSRMTSRGAAEDKVAAGKTLAVYGYPASDGDPELRAEHITIEGQQIQLR